MEEVGRIWKFVEYRGIIWNVFEGFRMIQNDLENNGNILEDIRK